jgi:hypothetical protein
MHRLPCVVISGESKIQLPGVFTAGESGLSGVFLARESRLLGVFATGESFSQF